jgi:hypothetical protein
VFPNDIQNRVAVELQPSGVTELDAVLGGGFSRGSQICRLMRGVERERKLEGKPPLVQFLPRSKRTKKTPKKAEGVHSTRKVNGSPTPASGVKSTVPEDAHAEEEKTQGRDGGRYSYGADQPGRTQAAEEGNHRRSTKSCGDVQPRSFGHIN